jgi:lysine 2,3-aminomutase
MISSAKRKSPELEGGDPALAEVAARYAVSITPQARATMKSEDLQDPVGRQYLPSAAELITTPEERDDPIGDEAHSPVKGIVHRYPDRVLLKPVHVCAVYCRFCFRREKVGPGAEALKPEELNKALAYIRNTPGVWEVILSGGDPLVLSPRRLAGIIEALNEIPHVQVIRLHTRVPVADPARVTDELIAALNSKKAVYTVLHCNHAQEVDANVRTAAEKFVRAGIPLLSQTTLLKGVNDSAETLEALFRTLTAMKVKPYYLHHPDLAPGTSHFRLSIAAGRMLIKQLWGRLSGIAQPRYVLDIPGGFGKVSAETAWIEPEGEEGAYTVTDYRGGRHRYKDSLPE